MIFTDLKKMQIEKTLTDRFAYIIFNGMFTVNLAKEIGRNKNVIDLLFKV